MDLLLLLFLSKRIFLEGAFISGGILVTQQGKIHYILTSQKEVNSWLSYNQAKVIRDFGNYIIMPGLIDTHVHVNEPGRTDWEGYVTATKAAAAGCFSTIADMPLNSIPPTTTVENLIAKKNVTKNKLFVDVALWGGVVPGNEDDLIPMVENGVVGFKAYLGPSGVPEFNYINQTQVEIAMEKLQYTGAVFAFHAERCLDGGDCDKKNDKVESCNLDMDPKKYMTYLISKPPSTEVSAIKMVTDLAVKYNVKTHIAHLSSAEALPYIVQAKHKGAHLTVETCHHYLTLEAEDIPDGHTEYKCSPPIRSKMNKKKLWKALKEGHINLLVSDHSPSTPELKLLTPGVDRGNFIKAWGGIASVQFGLSLLWTNCQENGCQLADVARLLSEEPARLVGLDQRKGKIAIGYDADFCVWDPDEEFTVTPNIIYFKNKANPYMGKRLRGVVKATIVRGNKVYQQHEHFEQPRGILLEVQRLKAQSYTPEVAWWRCHFQTCPMCPCAVSFNYLIKSNGSVVES